MIEAELYDGTVLEFPDETDPAVIQSVAKRETERLRGGSLARSRLNAAETYSPTEGMSTGEKLLAGAGKAFVDTARGVGQLVGAVDREDVAEARALDAPLMDTTAGKAGNFAGNAALIAPTMAIPGANTVTGAGLIGAATGLVQPSTSTTETLANVGLGGALGAGGQAVGQKIAQQGAKMVAGRTAQAADQQAQNAVRDATIAEARRVGYRVPPATINPESAAARATESVAGKVATQQTAAWRNQQVTNRLIREELGLPKNTPLTRDTLAGVRKKAGQVYAAVEKTGRITPDQQFLTDVANLGSVMDDVAAEFPGAKAPSGDAIRDLADSLFQDSFDAAAAVKYVRSLRDQAKAGFKAVAAAEGGAEKQALARAQWEAAGMLEDMIERHLVATGRSDLAGQFAKSRTLIAKSHSAEAALSPQGNVVASRLLTQWRRNKPLSPKFDLIARFAGTVGPSAAETTSSPGVNALTALMTGGTGVAGAALGHPEAMAVMGIPAARMAAQQALLTRPVQALATPRYSPSLLGPRAVTVGGQALDPLALAYLWANAPQQ